MAPDSDLRGKTASPLRAAAKGHEMNEYENENERRERMGLLRLGRPRKGAPVCRRDPYGFVPASASAVLCQFCWHPLSDHDKGDGRRCYHIGGNQYDCDCGGGA